jgi:hypothetical protein
MASSTQRPSVARLTATLSAVCDFLTDPACRQCDVLAVCLRRLQEDVSELGSSSLRKLPGALRQVSPPIYVHSRFRCQRCGPAELLATYLTPGEENRRLGVNTMPALSWIVGDQDMHY